MAHKAHAVPDPCAPKQGTYGVDYGPDGNGGCILGTGRIAQADGTQAGVSDRAQAFGDQMWDAFHACAVTCTCPGQVCTAPPGHGDDDAGAGGGSGGGDDSSNSGCCQGSRAPSPVSIFMCAAVLVAIVRRRRRS